MYIRFVCDAPHPKVAGAELGFWCAEETIKRPERRDRMARRHLSGIDQSMRFFGALHRPNFKALRVKRWREGLFWFHADAAMPGHGPGTMVWRAEEFAGALTRAGIEIRKLEATDPGEILWSDAHQALIRPTQPVPRAFPLNL